MTLRGSESGDMESRHRASPGWRAWAIFVLGAVTFSFAFFQRVAPSVMVQDLMREFAVGAAVLGNLSALYFYAYAGLQIPIGVMVDRWGARAILTLALLLAANAAAAQQPPEPAARATHDIWIMSTRCLGHPCCEAQGAEVAVWQRTGPSDWERRRLKDFYAQPADMPVAFFIYGNNIETDEVFTRGWDTLQALLPESSSPIRFVIWSWPSDRIRGPVQNVRRKADRTEIDSYYLARVLARMPAGREVSILAYSFGGRLATGALHLAAGGNLSCVSLDEAGAAPTVRLVLIAPAMHNYWLNPGAYHGRAASLWSELLVLYNPCDSVLRFYRFLDRRNRPAALGYTGSSHYLPRTREINAGPYVGRTHDHYQYLRSDVLMSEIRNAIVGAAAAP